MKPWKDTCERFIAFFDVMGFKNYVFRNPHERVRTMMKGLDAAISQIRKREEALLTRTTVPFPTSPAFDNAIVRPVLFSDSILLVSSDDSQGAANKMLLSTAFLLSQCMAERIPIKGAIAAGRHTSDFKHSMHFGRPLIDAYELQNELCIYGGVLHHSMERPIAKDAKYDQFAMTVMYDVPFKTGRVKHRIIDWVDAKKTKTDALTEIMAFYDTVSGGTRRYVDHTAEYTRVLLDKHNRETALASETKK